MRIFNASVLSKLLLSCETWCLPQNLLDKLESFQTRCLRRIIWKKNVFQKNPEVRKKCQQPTVESIIRSRRLSWLGHVQRMKNDRIPKILLWGKPSQGKQKQQRMKLRWTDLIHEDLKHHSIQPNEWTTVCQDRKKWRSIIKTDRSFVTKKERSKLNQS